MSGFAEAMKCYASFYSYSYKNRSPCFACKKIFWTECEFGCCFYFHSLCLTLAVSLLSVSVSTYLHVSDSAKIMLIYSI